MTPDQLVLFGALGALFVSIAILAGTVLGIGMRSSEPGAVLRRRLSLYTLTGRGTRLAEQQEQRAGNVMTRGALDVADRMIRRRGFDEVLARRLEAAGLPMRTAEWMLVHVGIGVGLAVLLLLLSGGGLFATALGLLLGLVGPWLFLVIREGRRESAFLAQLPDSLQMLAGSLQAGYSLAQALDTVVREAPAPLSQEFNRALIESRLGIPIEDALEGIAGRMSSQDFSWVVMAIRIQREVGGNLAELLTTVAATLRERERLRRQVSVLSAEGRLSAWVLGSLPPVFALYLAVARPEYLQPMASPLGLIMVIVGLSLLAVGAFWLSRVVKVQV